MARSANPDSASSQFFIVVADSPHLDGQYSAFGKVSSGLDVVDKIVAEETDHRDNPLEAVAMAVKIVE
jgi:peptidyl-prolyl cis-trans isomerase B (cyclophilin B)